MPLKGCSIEAFNANVEAEVKSGKPRSQAVMTAARVARAACKAAGKPLPADVRKEENKAAVKTIAVDLNGVLSDYQGWRGADYWYEPREGSRQFLEELKSRGYRVVVTSARDPEGVREWLTKHELLSLVDDVTDRKIRATVSIDDRGINFDGDYQTALEKVDNFRTHWRHWATKTVVIDRFEPVFKGCNCKAGGEKCNCKARRKARTPEYLERALALAKDVLPHKEFAIIQSAARGHAGGTIAARNRRERMSAVEKMLVESIPASMLSDPELVAAHKSLKAWRHRAERLGRDVGGIAGLGRRVEAAMAERGIQRDSGAWPAPDRTASRKGFHTGEPDGGMHAHGLDRRSKITTDDGGHWHLWQLPGGSIVWASMHDGHHAHAVAEGSRRTDSGGEHSHVVWLPDGTEVRTKIDGPHSHDLMVETTGFDGSHVHELELDDGTVVKSLTAAQIAERFGSHPPIPIYDGAWGIASAPNEVRRLEDELYWSYMREDDEGPSHVAVMSAEVVGKSEDGIDLDLSDVPLGTVLWDRFEGDEPEVGDIVEVGWDGYIGPSTSTEPDDLEPDARRSPPDPVDLQGPPNAPLVFMAAMPSEVEHARKRAFVGRDGIEFERNYLEPLGLSRDQIAAGFVAPVPVDVSKIADWRERAIASLDDFPDADVVAVGKLARNVLGDVARFYFPHPSATADKHPEHLQRKITAVRKTLDARSANEQNARDPGQWDQGGARTQTVRVLKADPDDEKQIVYAVVLSPYEFDAHGDWPPPSEIEATAHRFEAGSRIIGMEHEAAAEAHVVESTLVHYPSDRDYRAAMANEDHRAYRIPYGSDHVSSGEWVLGVKLGDAEWELHKQGELNAFSIGSTLVRVPVTETAMPEVEFVDLVPSP